MLQLHTRRVFAAVVLLASIGVKPAIAQLTISTAEGQNIKFGFQGQFWADFQQDLNTTATQGYQQNLYLRRIRLIAGGQLAKDVTFFFETDQPNLGKTPKALNSGFMVQDAFIEYRIANAFRLDGGLMLVPFSRNTLQSTANYYTLDISPITTVNNTSTQSSGLRDLGLQARGFFLRDKLLYRLGMFSGERTANARSSLRSAGYLQYDFLSPETGYVFPGTTLGKQKLLAVSSGFDRQGAYRAYSAGVNAAIPVRGGDEVGGQVQFIHYDGKTRFLTIPEQNDVMVEGAYYVKAARVQPFVKYETQRFVADANLAKNYERWGGGANYYVRGTEPEDDAPVPARAAAA